VILHLDDKTYIDTSIFFDASIGLSNTSENPRAWYVDFPIIEPVVTPDFVGSVAAGNSVNFRTISFNPHGHGTHIECLGHVTKEVYSVNQLFKDYFIQAQLITISPEKQYNETYQQHDLIITANQLKEHIKEPTDCLMIRTLPNSEDKKHRNYSNTNFPYLHADCVAILNTFKVKHLVVDLPSVDRENDHGLLAFHKAFWNVNSATPAFDKTITEFAYFSAEIPDGKYLVNMQVAPIENDATPCRPLLFPLKTNTDSF
jgi:kynurenine formamidase